MLGWNLAVVATIVFAGVLYLTSYKTFYVDEWAFVTTRLGWTWDVFMLSHNGHWSTLFILVWKVLFVTFGITSHLPYQAAALVAHVAAVAALFALVRRQSGDAPAFVAGTTLLLLGSGAQNIDWAFQLGWTASVAFGLVSMILLDSTRASPTRIAVASAALLCSLMFSNVGLVFLGAVAVELALDRKRWPSLAALVIPAAIFIAWFVTFDTGSFATAPGVSGQIGQGPTGVSYLIAFAAFIAYGLKATAAGVFGLPAAAGLLALSVVAALVAIDWYRRPRPAPWQVALGLGVLAWFALVGLGRLEFGASYAGESRYVYIGAVFLLPLVASAIRDLPWRGFYRPALAALFAACLFGNSLQLRVDALSQTGIMKIETAELQTVEAFRGAPDMALNIPIDGDIMPTIDAGPYFTAIDQLGSPVPHASLDQVGREHPDAVDKVVADLFSPALRVAPDPNTTAAGLNCRQIDASRGSTLQLGIPFATAVMLKSANGGEVTLSLGYLRPPTGTPAIQAQLLPATEEWIHVPDAGRPLRWRLQITAAPMGKIDVCGNVAIQVVNGTSGIYSAEAASGELGSGWSATPDSDAIGGIAAKATAGKYPSFHNDVFMNPLAAAPDAYDVWFRARVSSTGGASPEMTLGLWDDQRQAWVGFTEYPASRLGTRYSWVKVASAVIPHAGDTVQFIASFSNGIGTDWFVDYALIQPAGTPAPA